MPPDIADGDQDNDTLTTLSCADGMVAMWNSGTHQWLCATIGAFTDSDSDGVVDAVDCAPNDASISQFALEVCDSVDNNCDGRIDTDDPVAIAVTWYGDNDGDGVAGSVITTVACAQPPGFEATATDCDDNDPQNYPGNTEICDGQDNDCDSSTIGDLTGLSQTCPAQSCLAALAANPGASDGMYWLDPDGDGVDLLNGYCDMTTDGGGWLLLATQTPDGGLYSSSPVSSVGYDLNSNQRYSNQVLQDLADLGDYHVMVEENAGPDRDAGLVMVYRMPGGTGLRFDSSAVPVSTVAWYTGNGQYHDVTNNEGDSGGWWGLSVHATAWNGLATSERCISKSDFSTTGGSNGDYKLDHSGSHSGTTRCIHSSTEIGVSHWFRN